MPGNGRKNRRVKPGFTGLCNLKASCYMNSIVQVFSHTYPLYTFFSNNVLPDGDNWDRELKPMSVEFRKVFRRIWGGKSEYFMPNQLYRTIKRLLPQYSPRRQADCHEFMISFNSILHDELKQSVDDDFTGDFLLQDEFSSIIRDTFYGQHSVEITCTVCSYHRKSTEVFNNLILSLPERRATLKEILNLHYGQQTVEDYECPECMSYNCCINKTTVTKNPQILVVCLKRFTIKFTDSGEYCEVKNTNKVDYPRRDLEFGGKKYELYAVIVHRADGEGISSGHYWVYCKNLDNDDWWKFNDDDVSKIRKRSVYQPKKSYLLFYQLSQENENA